MTELLRDEAPPGAQGAAETGPERVRPEGRGEFALAASVITFLVIMALIFGVIASPGAAGGCGGG